MTKKKFLSALEKRLKGFSREERAERISFYSEAIDDRMDDGLTEEQAVSQLGTVDEIAGQILNDPQSAERLKSNRRLSALEIVLLVLGSPVWISLLVALFSVVISLYAVLWSLVVSVWAVAVSLSAVFIAGIAGTVLLFVTGKTIEGLILLSVALFCGGLSIFVYYGCKFATMGAARLTKKSALWMIGLFVRKKA